MIATNGLCILKQRFVWVCMTGWWVLCIRNVYHVSVAPFQISGNVFGIQGLFMHQGLAVLRKHLTGHYRQIIGGMTLSCTCYEDLGTPLEWRHSNLISLYRYFTFRNDLSSKDTQLRVLIKEALAIFHWLTFRIALLCSLFWYKRQVKNHSTKVYEQMYTFIWYIYIYTYIYIYIQIYQWMPYSDYPILRVEIASARKRF